MRRIAFASLVLVFVSTSIACGAISNLVGGGDNFKPTAQMWADVPKMDGLTPSALEDIPLPLKLVMRTIIGNLGRLNPEGEDQSTGNIDWIAFDSSGTADDVKNFYSPALMAANGWDASDTSTCVSGADQGMPQVGEFCVFAKTSTPQQSMLAIIATQDESTKKLSVFFLRLDQIATPTP